MSAPLGPYTPVVRAGDFVIVSGQGGIRDGSDRRGRRGGPDDPDDRQRRRPSRRGGTPGLTDVVKTLCFLTDMGTFAEFNDAYAAAFGDHRPARSDGRGVGAPRRDGGGGGGLGVQAGMKRARGAAGRFLAGAGWARHRRGRTSPTTTPSGACRRGTLGGCSSSCSSRAPRPDCRGRRSCNKREGYARCFAGYDPAVVAAFGPDDVERCLADPGIVRNRAKVDGRGGQRQGVAGARRPGGVPVGVRRRGPACRTTGPGSTRCPASTAASEAMSKELADGRLPLRRTDDLLRPHAVLRPRQRPPRRLFPLRRVRPASVSRPWSVPSSSSSSCSCSSRSSC